MDTPEQKLLRELLAHFERETINAPDVCKCGRCEQGRVWIAKIKEILKLKPI